MLCANGACGERQAPEPWALHKQRRSNAEPAPHLVGVQLACRKHAVTLQKNFNKSYMDILIPFANEDQEAIEALRYF